MNARLPVLKARDIIRALRKLGFAAVRQKGSHIFFKHPDGRFTVVPYHSGENISRGLLRQILKETNTSADKFLELL